MTPHSELRDEIETALEPYNPARNTPRTLDRLENLFLSKRQEWVEEAFEELHDRLYDDGRIYWGEPTPESVEKWGENHADLAIPTRYVHRHIDDVLAHLKEQSK